MAVELGEGTAVDGYSYRGPRVRSSFVAVTKIPAPSGLGEASLGEIFAAALGADPSADDDHVPVSHSHGPRTGAGSPPAVVSLCARPVRYAVISASGPDSAIGSLSPGSSQRPPVSRASRTSAGPEG